MIKLASKFIRNKHVVYSFFIGIVLLTECKSPEEYSTTPAISFNNIELLDGNPLVLTLNFTDGDGNLGLESIDDNENNLPLDALYPYHGFGAITDSQGKFITSSSSEGIFPWVYVFPNDSSSAFNLESTDIRPSFSCLDYEIGYTNSDKTFFTSDLRYINNENPLGSSVFYSLNGDFSNVSKESLILDSVFVIRNENRFNILVDFFIKKNGTYEEFDWLTYFIPTGCGGIDYNGRFGVLDESSFGSSLEGTLSYSMKTIGDGFRLVFKTDTLKLRVTIKDRSLNTSNTIDTPDFTLQQINK